DAVAATRDLARQLRTRGGALADQEKGRFRAVRIEQVEDGDGVVGRAVVDGQPDGIARRQAREHGAVQRRIRRQHAPPGHGVRGQHQRQPDAPAPSPPGPGHQRLGGQQQGQPGVRAARRAVKMVHARMMPSRRPRNAALRPRRGDRANMGGPLQGFSAMSLDPAVRARIDALLQANRAVLFMKGAPSMPQCGFSAKAVSALDALEAEYAHVDVLSDPEIREGIKAYGDWPTIPQLYINGELVGGSDIIGQMVNSGELHTALGLPAPDRTPPSITITPAALKMIRQAIADAGGEVALLVDVDRSFRTRLNLGP